MLLKGGLVIESCGERSIAYRRRAEVERAQVKGDRSLEPLLVSGSSSVALDFLDHRIETLRACVGRTGDHSGQDAFQMMLDHSRTFLTGSSWDLVAYDLAIFRLADLSWLC